jgi:flagellar basal-body rod modification protein FlgD
MQVTSSTAVNTSTYDTSELDVNNDHGAMGQEEFLKLFITQLQNQDPMEPMDDAQMMEQTATFTQVELLTSMEENIEKIASGSQEQNDMQMMMSASGYIGKLVEYEGTDTYLSSGMAPISFETDAVPFKTEVVITDEAGQYVRTFKPQVTSTDKMTIYWDGTDSNGNAMPEGSYNFSVVATGVESESIDVKTYGNGLVTGVTQGTGGIIYEVDGSEVSADKVVSVRDPQFGGAL